MLWAGFSAVAGLAGALLLVGCGGAGGPTWSSSGPSYPSSSPRSAEPRPGQPAAPVGSVRGIVEMPVRPSGFSRPVALREWLRIGAPAHADARVARSPLVGARVSLVDRASKETVSTTVTTDARGEFRIANVTPSPRFSVRATDGQVTLEAVLPEGDREVRVTVNEATTVGAEAARIVEDEGVTPEGALRIAAQIAEAQEAYQEEHPAEIPDLSRPADVQTRARQHLARAADAAIAAALDAAERGEAWEAVAAAQFLARANMKLSPKVRLTPLQCEAIVSALAKKEARAVSAEQILAAAKKGGIKRKDGRAITSEDLGAVLETLRKPLPSLKEVKLDKVPVHVALLIFEQNGTGFQVTTREQVKGFLKELVGEVEPAGKSKPAGSSAAKGKKGSATPASSPKPADTAPATEGGSTPPAAAG